MSDDCVPMLHWNWCDTHDSRWEYDRFINGDWWRGPVCYVARQQERETALLDRLRELDTPNLKGNEQT